jgi:hypothetical protein
MRDEGVNGAIWRILSEKNVATCTVKSNESNALKKKRNKHHKKGVMWQKNKHNG